MGPWYVCPIKKTLIYMYQQSKILLSIFFVVSQFWNHWPNREKNYIYLLIHFCQAQTTTIYIWSSDFVCLTLSVFIKSNQMITHLSLLLLQNEHWVIQETACQSKAAVSQIGTTHVSVWIIPIEKMHKSQHFFWPKKKWIDYPWKRKTALK